MKPLASYGSWPLAGMSREARMTHIRILSNFSAVDGSCPRGQTSNALLTTACPHLHAITRRLLPGTLPLPPQWDIQLLAAFFPGLPLEDIAYIDEIAGHTLKPDEVSYCGLVPGDGVASPHDADSGT
jgi:hypothetical protein